jgi:hypothetical protein
MDDSLQTARGDFPRLEQISQQRLAEWDLTSRERMLAGWIIRLSYGRSRESCLVPTLRHWRRLTGLDEADLCRAIQGLQEAGILQVSGPRRGPRRYTFLPNALLVEPDRVVDPDDAQRCLAELEELNALGPGFEPGGQKRLDIVTTDERVDENMAQASRELAVERQDSIEARFGAEWVKKMTARSLLRAGTITEDEIGESPIIGKTPIENEIPVAKRGDSVKLSPGNSRFGEISSKVIGESPIEPPENRPKVIGESPIIGKTPIEIVNKSGVTPGFTQACAPARTHAPACDVYVKRKDNTYTSHVAGAGTPAPAHGGIENVDVDVGCQPISDVDVRYALEQVRQIVPEGEFDSWKTKWEIRCRTAPLVIQEAVGDVKMFMRRQRVMHPGAAVFRRAQSIIRDRGMKVHLS